MINLKFSDVKRPLVSESRRKTGREVVLEGIQHQIALLNDPSYRKESTKYVKDEKGNSTRKVVTAPPRPWYWKGNDSMLVQIKYGHGTIVEIEPGKPTIVAGADTKSVLAVLTQVADAIKAGKLDAQIATAREQAKKVRKAAA
jgi:hypothetical protein